MPSCWRASTRADKAGSARKPSSSSKDPPTQSSDRAVVTVAMVAESSLYRSAKQPPRRQHRHAVRCPTPRRPVWIPPRWVQPPSYPAEIRRRESHRTCPHHPGNADPVWWKMNSPQSPTRGSGLPGPRADQNDTSSQHPTGETGWSQVCPDTGKLGGDVRYPIRVGGTDPIRGSGIGCGVRVPPKTRNSRVGRPD